MRLGNGTFPAVLARDKADKPAVIREAAPRRPDGVLEVRLYVEDGVGRLVSLWRDRATLEAYLDAAEVPRGTELMRSVGVEPDVRIADVLQHG